MAALAINSAPLCEDVAECESVDNIIEILAQYHVWNEKQLSRIGLRDYSSLASQSQSHIVDTDEKQSASAPSEYTSLICSLMDDDDYDELFLLNDFHHVLDTHCGCGEERSFEWIYSELTDKCSIESRVDEHNAILHRTHYSRDLVYGDVGLISTLYYGCRESKSIHTFEILDAIYVYFLHSFDFGFRFRLNDELEMQMEERQRIEEEDELAPEINIDATLSATRQQLAAMNRKLYAFDTLKASFTRSNRFVTNYGDAMMLRTTRGRTAAKHKLTVDEAVQNDVDEKVNFNVVAHELMERRAHLIGRRWHYSSTLFESTDVDTINGGVSGDWHCATKYENIKHEILNNTLCALPMNCWVLNYSFASIQMRTQRAKHTVRVMANRWKTFYDLNQQTFADLPDPMNMKQQDILGKKTTQNTISINHILAILFYCNFSELSRYFCATYLDCDSCSLVQWKAQHCEFANLGRLVREAIEDYGDAVQKDTNREVQQRFYHGLDSKFVCSSTMIRFCAPVSCSTLRSCILQYVGDESGVILECKPYTPYLRFFDANWLSLHCAENEKIFCGGDWPLRIESILDMRSCFNYRYYLLAMNILMDLIRGEYNQQCEVIDDKIKYTMTQIFSSRLWKRNAIPSYVAQLFDEYFSCECVHINMQWMKVQQSGYKQIKSLILCDFDDAIKFDVLCTVFSSVQIFKFEHYRVTQNNMKHIVEFACNQYPQMQCALQYIVFEEPNQAKHAICKSIVKHFTRQLRQLNWQITYKKKNKSTNGAMLVIAAPNASKNDKDCNIM
eukprot:163549_1